MNMIEIREPFWGAGSPKMYGWKEDGFAMGGIGIRGDLVRNNLFLEVRFRGEKHVLDCREGLAFATKYGSIEDRGGHEIIVISLTLFRRI